MIGKTVSHYRIISKLGEGGMGVVYVAEDTRLDRRVALKFLPTSLAAQSAAKKRFIHEAKAASSLEHPNICTVLDIAETDDGQMFIAMPHYEGETLQERIARGPLAIGEAIDIVKQLASGLTKAHERGIVHRDIKPGNIFVTDDGHVKILDFGLAKLATETRLTKSGTTLGTIAYMSPEQAGGGEVDTRSDIFSVGAVFYELLTGAVPFRGDHEAAVIYGIMHNEPDPLQTRRRDVPERLQRVIDRALAKNVNERYQFVGELLTDLGGEQAPGPHRPKNPMKYTVPLVVVVAAVLLWMSFGPFRAGGPSTPDAVTLAVLPFENLGAPEDEYFADGITEEITSRLAIVKGMKVISRTSTQQYKDTEKGLREIGDELGVNYILEGTIRWDKAATPERVRITPQLIAVSDDFHLWAENYERDMSQIFAVQVDIASRIVEALDVTLLASERETLESRPTENLDAYHAYLSGLDLASRRENESTELGIQMLERAVNLDPKFAVGYASLANAHLTMYHFGDRTDERLSSAKAALDKAFELNPELPEAHQALARYYYIGFKQFDRALKELEIAERGLPNDSGILETGAYIKRRQGQFEVALDRFERAFELNPRRAWLPLEIGVTCAYLRRFAEADRYLDRSISISPEHWIPYIFKAYNYIGWRGDTKQSLGVIEEMPGDARDVERRSLLIRYLDRDYKAILHFVSTASEPTGWHYRWAAAVYTAMGEPELAYASYDSARVIYERRLLKDPDSPGMHSGLGIAFAGIGLKEDAIRESERAVELFPLSLDAYSGIEFAWNLAVVYTMVGEYDSAIDEIEHLLTVPSSINTNRLRLDPDVDRLRHQPRFQQLLEKYSTD